MSYYAMNTYTLVTGLGAMGVVLAFSSGMRASILYGQGGIQDDLTSSAWRMVFYMAVFVTILAAPLSN
jgi:hypothetical protein